MLLRADLFSALALPIGLALVVQSGLDVVPAQATDTPMSAHGDVSFSEQVLPILESRCVECHGNQSAELGLNLETYDGVMAGSDYGTVIEAGSIEGSLLVDMIESGDMPEEGDPVPPEELELIKNWILEGAKNN
jgi:hypothetical protein